jgi:uncharacterized SAM-binding protein YcdF (DUF218 family)
MMFVFLSKFIPLWFYPLGLIWLLLITYLLLTHKNSKGSKWRWIIILVVVIIFLGGNRWVPAMLARTLEWRYLPPDHFPSNQMVVVLGGGTESQQYPRQMTETNGAGDRVLYAAKLYQSGIAEHILLSGGNIEWSGSRSTTPAQDMEELLLLMNVPKDVLILQDQSRNTAEDAQFSAAILRERNIEEIILVTSASHMWRSVALFEKQGIKVIPAPTDYSITYVRWNALWRPTLQDLLIGLVPNAGNLSDVTYVLKEYLGFAVYRVRGWL